MQSTRLIHALQLPHRIAYGLLQGTSAALQTNYTITPMGGQPAMKDGPTLLKRLIMLTYIDNRATTAHIRETLIDMTYQLTNLQGDITAFNDWVREQVCQLVARGTSAPDLLTYLWKT